MQLSQDDIAQLIFKLQINFLSVAYILPPATIMCVILGLYLRNSVSHNFSLFNMNIFNEQFSAGYKIMYLL